MELYQNTLNLQNYLQLRSTQDVKIRVSGIIKISRKDLKRKGK